MIYSNTNMVLEEMIMNKDFILIITEWIITTSLLVKFIPKNKIREACIAFFLNKNLHGYSVLPWCN